MPTPPRPVRPVSRPAPPSRQEAAYAPHRLDERVEGPFCQNGWILAFPSD